MLYGIDVSTWQGAINWPAVAASGKSFAICKRSEGAGGIDPTFAANWAGVQAAGMVRGCYHFAHPEINTPQAEAAFFLAGLPALEPGDLVALDIEAGGTADRSAWALAWLRQVEQAIGFPPLCYSYIDYINRCLTSPDLAAYPLWLASYSPSCPPRIGPWPSVAIWQYSESLSVPGVAGNVDGDQLARDLAGLKALGKPAPAPALSGRLAVSQVCGLKKAPAHGGADLATIPAGGQVMATTQTANGFTLVNYRGVAGWVPSAYLQPISA